MNTNEILNERENTHGKYSNVAMTSQALKHVIQQGAKFNQLTPAELESLELICMKISRIVNGNPHLVMHWEDISGYATLIVKELEK